MFISECHFLFQILSVSKYFECLPIFWPESTFLDFVQQSSSYKFGSFYFDFLDPPSLTWTSPNQHDLFMISVSAR